MLAFCIAESGKSIEITCNAAGMALLRKELEKLVAERVDHVHLFGPRNGGNALDDTDPWGALAVSEVIINYNELG